MKSLVCLRHLQHGQENSIKKLYTRAEFLYHVIFVIQQNETALLHVTLQFGTSFDKIDGFTYFYKRTKEEKKTLISMDL